MIGLIIAIGFGIILFIYCLPSFYTWVGWSFYVPIVSSALIASNLTLFIVGTVIYYLMPKKVIDYIFKELTIKFRSIFKEKVDNMEKNMRESLKIKTLYPIPNKCILIWQPHGMIAVSMGIHNGFKVTDSSYNPTKFVAHIYFHHMPIITDVLRQIGGINSDFSTIKSTLQNESVSISLGGIDEMGRLKHKQLELVIRKRKGIFRIALETGSPIVPVLTYGENELFPETDNAFLVYINKQLYKHLKIRLPFLSFESMNNWLKLTTQSLDPIYTYTGRPIHVKKIENPTPRQIDILRRVYIQRVRELFKETNNGEYTLKIV